MGMGMSMGMRYGNEYWNAYAQIWHDIIIMICRIRNKRKLKSQESNYDGMIEYGHGTMGIDDI